MSVEQPWAAPRARERNVPNFSELSQGDGGSPRARAQCGNIIYTFVAERFVPARAAMFDNLSDFRR